MTWTRARGSGPRLPRRSGWRWTALRIALAVSIPAAAAAAAAGTTTTATTPAPLPAEIAAETPTRSARIPLLLDFSTVEMVVIGGVVATSFVLSIAGPRLLGQPSPSFGSPAPNSFDRTWANRLHLDDGAGHRFLGRAPDIGGGYVLPFLPAAVYGIDALTARSAGEGALSDDRNADHRLLAYAEALGWTELITHVTKFVVGRQRPYVVLEHPELSGPAREANLSFFSNHTSVIFASAAFVSLDVSRRLRSGTLAGVTPAEQWLLGTLVPYTATFAVASFVGVSRVIDQQHWPTDVLAGAAVGTIVGRLVYGAHFDTNGTPRLRHVTGSDSNLQVVPTRRGVSVTGVWQ